MRTLTAPGTADELSRLPDGWRYEIDRGELIIMAPAGRAHARITGAITRNVGNFVHDHQLGEVDSGEVGVYIERQPVETLRGIDVAYFSAAKVAMVAMVARTAATARDADDGAASGFWDVLPDLAIEVHDASDPALRRKVHQYRTAGIPSVWVVDPKARSLTQYGPSTDTRTLTDPADMVRDPVLPGFTCRLLDFFE